MGARYVIDEGDFRELVSGNALVFDDVELLLSDIGVARMVSIILAANDGGYLAAMQSKLSAKGSGEPEWRVKWQQCPHVRHDMQVRFVRAQDEKAAKAVARAEIEREYGIGWLTILEAQRVESPYAG